MCVHRRGRSCVCPILSQIGVGQCKCCKQISCRRISTAFHDFLKKIRCCAAKPITSINSAFNVKAWFGTRRPLLERLRPCCPTMSDRITPNQFSICDLRFAIQISFSNILCRALCRVEPLLTCGLLTRAADTIPHQASKFSDKLEDQLSGYYATFPI